MSTTAQQLGGDFARNAKIAETAGYAVMRTLVDMATETCTHAYWGTRGFGARDKRSRLTHDDAVTVRDAVTKGYRENPNVMVSIVIAP